MQLSLSKNSEVPLREQIAEQIVFLITTGELRAGQQLPSVRSLARRVNVHHNTVSEAYQDLVRRNWLSRQRGSRLVVGKHKGSEVKSPKNLDELINETIERAKRMGFSLRALTDRVRERILAQPPDHILIVEEEPGLREIIRREVQDVLNWRVESCSPRHLVSELRLAVGAEVLAPSHIVEALKQALPLDHVIVPIAYSGAEAQIEIIRNLTRPSIIAAVSISESLLKTARGLFAPAITRRHTFRAIAAPENKTIELGTVDVAFCDSCTMEWVECRRKIPYRLVAPRCLEHLATPLQSGNGRGNRRRSSSPD